MSFNEVREYLADIPGISKGGCGVAALAMYLWLKKHNAISDGFAFVLLYSWFDDDEEYENNAYVLLSKKGNATAPCHIAIRYNEHIIDVDSAIDISHWGKMQVVTDEWFIWNMINNVGSWNPTFDRDYIKQIESKLGIELKDKDDKTSTTLQERARIYFGRVYDDIV
jgi:hypothetical protein